MVDSPLDLGGTRRNRRRQSKLPRTAVFNQQEQVSRSGILGRRHQGASHAAAAVRSERSLQLHMQAAGWPTADEEDRADRLEEGLRPAGLAAASQGAFSMFSGSADGSGLLEDSEEPMVWDNYADVSRDCGSTMDDGSDEEMHLVDSRADVASESQRTAAAPYSSSQLQVSEPLQIAAQALRGSVQHNRQGVASAQAAYRQAVDGYQKSVQALQRITEKFPELESVTAVCLTDRDDALLASVLDEGPVELAAGTVDMPHVLQQCRGLVTQLQEHAEQQQGAAQATQAALAAAAAAASGSAVTSDSRHPASSSGGLTTAKGRLDPARAPLLADSVPAAAWGANLRPQRRRVQELAHRQGPHQLFGRHAPVRQQIGVAAGPFDVQCTAADYAALSLTYGGRAKLDAARYLDSMVNECISAARVTSQAEGVVVGWSEHGLSVQFMRAVFLRLIDPKGLRHKANHLPEEDVVGYAVSTTLANCLMGLEALHAVRNLQVNPDVTAMLRSEMNGFLRKLYPHVLRRAQPVTWPMVKDALDTVEEVQLPQLGLKDGSWLQDIRLDRLRNRYNLSIQQRLGRREGHSVPLNEEHYEFKLVGSLHDDWSIEMQINFVLGKGTRQSQQRVPVSSRVYNMQDDAAITDTKMRYDPVMLALLLLYCQNSTELASWEATVQHPGRLSELRAHHGMMPQLTSDGLPTGYSWELHQAQFAFTAIMHAAGYPGCTAHGARSGMLVNTVSEYIARFGYLPDQAWVDMERIGGWERNSNSLAVYIRDVLDGLLGMSHVLPIEVQSSSVVQVVRQLMEQCSNRTAAGVDAAGNGAAELLPRNAGISAAAELLPQTLSAGGNAVGNGGVAAAVTAAAGGIGGSAHGRQPRSGDVGRQQLFQGASVSSPSVVSKDSQVPDSDSELDGTADAAAELGSSTTRANV